MECVFGGKVVKRGEGEEEAKAEAKAKEENVASQFKRLKVLKGRFKVYSENRVPSYPVRIYIESRHLSSNA